MARLNRNQIKQITDIINNHMEVLMQLAVGDGTPSPALVKKLGLPKEISSLITDAYKYGKLSVLKGKDLSKLSAADVEKMMRDLKLSKAQQYAVDGLNAKAQLNINSLTQKITTTVISSAIQNDMNLWTTVKDVIPAAMENGTPRYQVIQELREKSGDWERDWHRVAHTEMWGAKCNGEVQAIVNGESPLSHDKGDTKVYMRPSPMACNKCKQLYLERDGKTPKVFKVTDLMANGTNYGKKQADWVACVPPLHPNCMCTINVMPKDTKFDDDGNLVLDF